MTSVNELNLDVEIRSPMKNSARKLKRLGQTPAVVYGLKTENLYLSIKTNTVVKYSGSQFDNKIFTLQSKDKKIQGLKVLKKDVAFHRVSRQPLHMDFLALDMSKKVRVTVEVKFLGKAKGVKESGGVFNALKRHIEVECLPHEIPGSFEIDIAGLDLNESYHVSDIKIPSNIKLVTRPEEALCSVSEAQEEVAAVAPETAAAGTASEEETQKSEGDSTDKSSDKKDSSKE
ncbi:MAG: 50S ribosomal protein L25 [Bdellovibrionales bacterium]|nr:50S ribosomal protein L25 [Bdellovibrionales bacterium]